MNRKFVSKSNLVLRKVLNSKDNLDIVQDFIEAFLKIKIKKIELNSYLEIKSRYLPSEENFGIVDVRVTKEDDEQLNTGIQFIDGYYIKNKMLLYYAQIHSNQLEHDKNRKVAKTTTINLLDFNYFNSKQYHTKLSIPSDLKDNIIQLHVLELPKFILLPNTEIERENAWMIYLTNYNSEIVEKVLEKFDKIKKLDDLLDKYWNSETMQ